MNGLALCAGVAGIELGLRIALGESYRTVCYVEREAYSAASDVARMEDSALDLAPIWDRVDTFDGRPWRGIVDIVSAGFPCQPVSCAGKRQGEADERWLWPHIHRIIREVGPSYVFLENVPGLFTSGFGSVLGGLADLGFDAEWDVFSAAGVGAPHLRRRVFIFAYANSLRGQTQLQFEGKSDTQRDGEAESLADSGSLGLERPHLHLRSREEEKQAAFPGGNGADVADANGEGWRSSEGAGIKTAGSLCGSEDVPDADGEGFQDGRPPGASPGEGENGAPMAFAQLKRCGSPWWATEPDVGRVAHGVPDRVDRLRALGNGVVPLVAAVAFRILSGRVKPRTP